jgi:hypothetical protein
LKKEKEVMAKTKELITEHKNDVGIRFMKAVQQ